MTVSSDIRLAGLTCEYPENPPGIEIAATGQQRVLFQVKPLVAGCGQHCRKCNLAQNT